MTVDPGRSIRSLTIFCCSCFMPRELVGGRHVSGVGSTRLSPRLNIQTDTQHLQGNRFSVIVGLESNALFQAAP